MFSVRRLGNSYDADVRSLRKVATGHDPAGGVACVSSIANRPWIEDDSILNPVTDVCGKLGIRRAHATRQGAPQEGKSQ